MTTYTMHQQHASDLSPAQSLLDELGSLSCACHQGPRSSSTCPPPTASALRALFESGLAFCAEVTAPVSWQRRRLYALLSAMYLEVIEHIDDTASPQELLSVAPEWARSPDVESSCLQCRPARDSARRELNALLAEMIRE